MNSPDLTHRKITGDAAATARLQHLPVSLFSVVMGLSGLTIAWRKALTIGELNTGPATAMAALTIGIFITIAALYLTKVVRHRDSVLAELHHPIKLNFFGTIPVSLVLLSIISMPMSHTLAQGFWLTGVVMQFTVLMVVMNAWMHQKQFKTDHLNPAWFIPAVGNILVPLSGIDLGFVETSWFFFSVGLLFWLVLLTIVFNRILFHEPIPIKLMPTLFILIAPPAIGFMSYLKLTDSYDSFAHVLYYNALFFTALLAVQFRHFLRLPFFLSSWAYSFPLAAVTTASWRMFEITAKPGVQSIALALLAITSTVILTLFVKTALAVSRDQICVPD